MLGDLFACFGLGNLQLQRRTRARDFGEHALLLEGFGIRLAALRERL